MNLKLQNLLTQWKVGSTYSEKDLEELASLLSAHLNPGDRIILEGPMGAGKSTFARFLISALGAFGPSAGSPTFALAHEYHTPQGEVVHLDFYRIQSEAEIDEAGMSAYYWEAPKIVISEWLSAWPHFYQHVVTNRYSPESLVIEVSFQWDQASQFQRLISFHLCKPVI